MNVGVVMMKSKNLNRDKAQLLHDTICDILATCSGDCKNCVLEEICDELDVLTFKLMELWSNS